MASASVQAPVRNRWRTAVCCGRRSTVASHSVSRAVTAWVSSASSRASNMAAVDAKSSAQNGNSAGKVRASCWRPVGSPAMSWTAARASRPTNRSSGTGWRPALRDVDQARDVGPRGPEQGSGPQGGDERTRARVRGRHPVTGGQFGHVAALGQLGHLRGQQRLPGQRGRAARRRSATSPTRSRRTSGPRACAARSARGRARPRRIAARRRTTRPRSSATGLPGADGCRAAARRRRTARARRAAG